MKKLKVILIGGGDRGMRYTTLMKNLPDKYEVIAVAEPIDNRREYIKRVHSLPDDMKIWARCKELLQRAFSAVYSMFRYCVSPGRMVTVRLCPLQLTVTAPAGSVRRCTGASMPSAGS